MYKHVSRNLSRFKQFENSFRPYSLSTGNRILQTGNAAPSTHNQTKDKPLLNLHIKHNAVNSFLLMPRRNFSLTALRSESAAATTNEAVATVAPDSTAAATNAVANSSADVASTAASEVGSNELVLDFLPDKPVPVDPSTVIGTYLA